MGIELPKVRLLSDRVLIDVPEESQSSKTSSGIEIVHDKDVEASKVTKRGIVVSVGPGRYIENGIFVTPGVSLGDEVLFTWGETIVLNGCVYYLVREAEIHMVIEK